MKVECQTNEKYFLAYLQEADEDVGNDEGEAWIKPEIERLQKLLLNKKA